MKKLKNKIFFIIAVILSLFLLTVLFIFNYQDYSRAKVNVLNNLFKMKRNDFDFDDKMPPKGNMDIDSFQDNPKRFMDVCIYTVILDQENQVKDIISHTEDGKISDSIQEVASKIILKNDSSNTYIGNLYLNRYSYHYVVGDYITIIDNNLENIRLRNSLKISILLIALLEMVILFISDLISKWIMRPVEESFQKQKEFIADASHELKTPLAVIMASSESIKETAANKKWLHNIKFESVRMSKLITSLLDLARIEENKNIVYEKINISKEVLKTILTMESLIYEKNIKLDYHIDENLFYHCNGEDIKELVTILLDNAINHSEELGNIIVHLKGEKDLIILEVANKGEAIPKGEEEKIFERFYKSDKSRNRNDNRYGLGLAIAKSIVLNYGGSIKATSKNSYATFQVILKSRGH